MKFLKKYISFFQKSDIIVTTFLEGGLYMLNLIKTINILILIFIIAMILLYRYDKKSFFEILSYIILLFIALLIIGLILFSKLDSIYEFFVGSN